jgi:S-formylglutathione hydrolase FrmB
MALIHVDHVPETVKVNLPLNVIVPDPGKMGDVPVAKRKVLYLLHGLSDDGSAWQRNSSIETYARAYGLVVVMPSFGRSFYINQPNGQNYFDYLVDELPHYLKDVFGLAPKRENTFIAGLSMGGYGTIKAALLRPEMYFAAASFSGVLSMDVFRGENHDPNDPRQAEFTQLFGDLTKLGGGEHDPAVWLKRGAVHPDSLPRLFIACGRQDDLYPLSIGFHKACQNLGVNSQYREEEGGHDWFFWDIQIRWFLKNVLGPMPSKG